MIFYIIELNTGKLHKRTIKENCSIQYEARNNYIVVRNYWSGEILHRYNIKNYGSVRFWAE